MRASMGQGIDPVSAIVGPKNVGIREGRPRAAGLMTNRRQTEDWALDLQAVLLAVASRISRV
jgi:hypothetical protein